MKDPAFEFESAGTVADQLLTLNYHYRSLADHVAAERMTAFIANLQLARNELDYGVWAYRPKASPSTSQKFAYVIFVVGMFFAIPTAIATVFMLFDGWRSKQKVRQRSTATLLLTGLSLLWAPAMIFALCALGLLTALLGSGAMSIAKDAASVIALLVMFFGSYWIWHAIWRNRWLRWAQARATEPQKIAALAKRYRLPFQLPLAPLMPAQIAWLAWLPQLCLVALFIAIAHFLGFRDALTAGLIAYYVVGTAMEWLAQGSQRLAIRMVKKGRFAEAIPKFQASYDFLSRNAWIDRWRAITLLSVSRSCLRELALVNIAFCLLQLGKEQEAIAYYTQALFEFPKNTVAAAELARLSDAHGVVR